MTVEELLFSTLNGIVANRCYPDVIPQKITVPVFPSIVYGIVTGRNITTNCGNVSKPSVLVQIDLYTETAKDRAKYSRQIQEAMNNIGAEIRDVPRTGFDYDIQAFRLLFQYMIYQ